LCHAVHVRLTQYIAILVTNATARLTYYSQQYDSKSTLVCPSLVEVPEAEAKRDEQHKNAMSQIPKLKERFLNVNIPLTTNISHFNLSDSLLHWEKSDVLRK